MNSNAPPTMLRTLTVMMLGMLLCWQSGCAKEEQPSEGTGAAVEPEAGRAVAGEDVLTDTQPVALQDAANPFPRRIEIPEFPRGTEWLNTKPLRKEDLKGKFVLLDFWTYCCINCIHILPELKKLEDAYADQLVVIGVHSAKFETEKDSDNIGEAILRYEIKHPVVNDADHAIWNSYGVSSWPTVLLVDPEGKAIWGTAGEITFDQVNAVLKRAVPYYRRQKLLDETPVRFELIEYTQQETPLRFPGRVLADEAGNRLFITDSNHNRIVVTDLDGTLKGTIGSGAIGRQDGTFDKASFDHPQGVALHGEHLYVADTENHLIRKIDLEKQLVTTVAGVGKQGRSAWPGVTQTDSSGPWVGRPKLTPINSPWTLWVHGPDLYIAMAGPHQIWKMTLNGAQIGPYAGNGREDIVDGLLLPNQPYGQTDGNGRSVSSFAQPSGLASDGEWLFVADSEGSSIRAVPFVRDKPVRTVVGTANEPAGRLFKFGDVDGKRGVVLLQHALGVVYDSGKIYITDTYNNKIKVIDAATGETHTLAGSGEPGEDDAAGTFDEPAGISFARGQLYVADTNNHLIRVVDPASGKVSTLTIDGLEPPARTDVVPSFKGADEVTLPLAKLKPSDGSLQLDIQLKMPIGWKINADAPMVYYTQVEGASGPITRDGLGKQELSKPSSSFTVNLPVTAAGKDTVTVSLVYYYCQEMDQGLCKIGSVVFTVPLDISDAGKSGPLKLQYKVVVD